MRLSKFKWQRNRNKLATSLNNWREGIELVIQNNVINTAVKLSLAVIVIGFLIIVLSWSRLPPEVPLFYSLPWGENQLADQIWLLVLPLLALGVTGFNLLVSAVVVKFDIMAAVVLNCTSVGVAVLVVITLFQIVSLMG